MILFFCHLSAKKGGEECLQGRWTGGGHVLFAKYNFNLSYICENKNPIFLYNCCQKWPYLLPIQIIFCSRLSLPSRNPKQQTVE